MFRLAYTLDTLLQRKIYDIKKIKPRNHLRGLMIQKVSEKLLVTLFDRHRLREIAWLIHIFPHEYRRVVGEHLNGNGV